MATIIRPGHTFDFDPDAKLLYGIDWSAWLATGAGIAVSDWAIEALDDADAAALTFDNAAVDGSIATLRLLESGTPLVAGARYKITNHVTTNETPAQEDDRSFKIRVKER